MQCAHSVVAPCRRTQCPCCTRKSTRQTARKRPLRRRSAPQHRAHACTCAPAAAGQPCSALFSAGCAASCPTPLLPARLGSGRGLPGRGGSSTSGLPGSAFLSFLADLHPCLSVYLPLTHRCWRLWWRAARGPSCCRCRAPRQRARRSRARWRPLTRWAGQRWVAGDTQVHLGGRFLPHAVRLPLAAFSGCPGCLCHMSGVLWAHISWLAGRSLTCHCAYLGYHCTAAGPRHLCGPHHPRRRAAARRRDAARASRGPCVRLPRRAAQSPKGCSLLCRSAASCCHGGRFAWVSVTGACRRRLLAFLGAQVCCGTCLHGNHLRP